MNRSFTLMTVLVGTLAFYGCDSAKPVETSQSEETIIKELQILNQKVDDLTKIIEKMQKKSTVSTPTSFVSRKANMEELLKIKPLSSNPSDDEIVKYIKQIADLTQGQNSFSPDDLQVNLYRKIGLGHIKLLLPYLNNHSHLHLIYALDSLVGEDDKDFIIKMLPANSKLLDVVIKKGWTLDAKEEIFTVMQHAGSLWSVKNVLNVLCQESKDRQRLAKLYTTNPSLDFAFEELKMYPDIDCKKIAIQAYENMKLKGLNNWQMRNIALNAAKYGNIDALENLAKIMNSLQNTESKLQADIFILTGQSVDNLWEWFIKNQKNITFDENEQKFIVKNQNKIQE